MKNTLQQLLTRESTKSLKTHWLVIGSLLIAIAAIGSWKLYQVLAPERVATALLNSNCTLTESECMSRFPDGTSVTISIDPKPIPVLQTIRLTSTISGVEVSHVEVDIVGVGMNMGYIRPKLSAIENTMQYSGESILPVCILDEMQWEARVMIHSKNGLLVAPFRFVTRKPLN